MASNSSVVYDANGPADRKDHVSRLDDSLFAATQSSMTDELYADSGFCQAILLDYSRNPRCAGTCDPASHCAEATNPACGDRVALTFQIRDGQIVQARTAGAGCAVSQATASLLVEQLQGKTLPEAGRLLAELDQLLRQTGGNPDVLERMLALRLITANPARVQCALVAYRAAMTALG